MLKINLLPPYIYEGKTRKVWVGVWILAVAAVVGGMLFYQTQLAAEAATKKSETDAIRADADKADRLKTEADGINNESAGIRAKNDFVKNSLAHNSTSYPKVFSNVSEYTINRVVLSSMTPAQGQVTVAGVAPTLADFAHYVMAMEHNPKINNVNVSIGSIPGFGPGQGQGGGGGGQGAAGGPPPNWHSFTAQLTLAQPIPGAPSYSGGGGGAGGPGGAAPGAGPAPGAGTAPSGKMAGSA